MIRSIVQLDLNVNYLKPARTPFTIAPLIPASTAGMYSLGYSTADNLVDELIALTGLVWLNVDLNVTVLTLTT